MGWLESIANVVMDSEYLYAHEITFVELLIG